MMLELLHLLKLSKDGSLCIRFFQSVTGSHNTFTQFYLKDVAWAESELYHLGPVVAAPRICQ